ncbi:MAG TPA: sigma-54 dependent transcriptional regulator [Burkholderiales bacterium]|nr:sigma-54 dependent transcriptional regulator [Burkholderiales bacterium]
MKEPAQPARDERILVIDDDPGICESVRLLLEQHGYRCDVCATGNDGLARAGSDEFDLLITDLRLPDVGGLDIIRSVGEAGIDLPAILMTSFSSMENAIEALRLGAVDYIIKPFNNDDFLFAVQRALNERRMRKENAALKRNLKKAFTDHKIIGRSGSIRRVFELIDKVSASDANVMIQGESGTGKELVAQAIHYTSPRADGPFIPVNCGAIPAELLESELFGHAKGAFTGALFARDGLIREADGGTLFLDEIAELALPLQVKLLRVIQDRQVRPVGSKHFYHSNVRFLAASNRNLKTATEEGAFRPDLFYRLNVINIHVPPLRERGDDVEVLARHFIEQHSRRLRKKITGIDDSFREFLYSYHWPGNVRELENLIERAVILAEGETLSASDFHDGSPAEPSQPRHTAVLADEALAHELPVEKYIETFVRRYQGDHSDSELAAMLGIGRKALWVRRHKWKLFRAGSRLERGRDDGRTGNRKAAV